MQIALGLFILKTTVGATIFLWLAEGVRQIYLFSDKGIQFLFGPLGINAAPWGVVFAFQVLPIIVFFGALTSLLFHLGIIQIAVSGVNKVFCPLLGTSGAESLCAIANIFLGQTEAPLLIKNYLKQMTKSEMFVVMVSGMATISGSIMAVYAKMGVSAVHMLAASVMAAPGAILIAKIMIPETDKTQTGPGADVKMDRTTTNIFDAIATGTGDGLFLALHIGAALLVFVALISMIDTVLPLFSQIINWFIFQINISWQMPILNLKNIFAVVFAPFAYLLGFAGVEASQVGELLGIKLSVNELVAYVAMLGMPLALRTQSIVTYALCGFANFSSIGIQISGIGSLAPDKKRWLAELGLKAVFASSLVNLLCALIASLML
jgi:CNT family concentrative nucleoside transporter